MKLLLTSAGLNNELLAGFFIKTMEKDMQSVKALFITTAANNPDAVEVLPKCLNDLLKVGITRENIIVYDMHAGLSLGELQIFDVIYICGGSTAYLLERMKRTGFDISLQAYAEAGGYVLGVSAGSIALASNNEKCLGIVDCCLHVHCEQGIALGELDLELQNTLRLTNEQAIYYNGQKAVVCGEEG